MDLVEEQADELFANEFKWDKEENVRFSQTFTTNYPNNKTKVLLPDNIEEIRLPGR